MVAQVPNSGQNSIRPPGKCHPVRVRCSRSTEVHHHSAITLSGTLLQPISAHIMLLKRPDRMLPYGQLLALGSMLL